MEVKSFILQNGQEIIAEVIGHSSSSLEWRIRNPLAIQMIRGKEGQPELGFAPVSMIHQPDEELTVYSTSILFSPADIDDRVVAAYVEQQTGLLIPSTTIAKQILHS